MPVDLRDEFLLYLSQPDCCELFYLFMKSEGLPFVLEFYLACDGLKNLQDQKINPRSIIELIYKHYLSTGKSLSSSSSSKFTLPDYLLVTIRQRLARKDFHRKFYDHAQEYILKYMLQMCYPKFRIEQESLSGNKRRRKKSSQRKSIVQCMVGKNDNEENLAQRNPKVFFQELKQRLIGYQTKNRSIEDDSMAILDRQIAKTIDDADNYLSQPLIRYDSGVGTDSSERFGFTFQAPSIFHLVRCLEIPNRRLMSSGIHLCTAPMHCSRPFLIFIIH